ncbi:MAG: deiodinase [Rhodospirillales bacterium]|nr:deiodinase [Rhodospirillales bacterium]
MRLNELYATYKDQVQFYIIYIREAHPASGWQVPNNLIDNVVIEEPTTDAERTAAASSCQIALDLHMPMLIDSIDNDIDKNYVGLPMRQFLIDADGKIAYAGDKGPFGWNDEAFEESLKKVLAG